MRADRWDRLAEWHNAWIAAPGDAREKLRAQLATDQPDLLTDADELGAATEAFPDFLERPAVVVAARDLADIDPALDAGTTIGPYRVVCLIARGGMGDVYRASDVRLGRDVALKVLAPSLARDRNGVERFAHESRVSSRLEHPNIVRVYDIGSEDDRPYLVTELLDGETLRDRIARGPLPIEDVRRIGAEIAHGLIAAHAAGLVHRDLKPENIFLTRDGVTKILDFGIAKLVQPETPRDAVSTMTGMLLGTAGYLAPEQILGADVDARADLFAAGSILFEMLTGTRAFAHEHTIDTLYAIVHEPTPDLSSIRRDVPAALDAIITRLLEKPADARFQTARDLEWALAHVGALTRSADAHASSSRPMRRRQLSLIMGGATIAALVIGGVHLSRSREQVPAASALTQATWTLPPPSALTSAPAVSPDGRRIAFASNDDRATRLMVRDLASLDPVTIPGTDGAAQPFWSPDGTFLGFFANGRLLKVAVRGGSPVALADAPNPKGGTWSTTGVIVFQPDFRDSGLYRVSADGGTARLVVAFDKQAGDTTYRWPVFLPDGVHFVYSVRSIAESRRGVYVGTVEGPARPPSEPLLRSVDVGLFAPSPDPSIGLLLSATDSRIDVRTIDLTRLAITGATRTLALPAAEATPHQPPLMGASAGLLAFTSSPVPWGFQVAFADRSGESLEIRPGRELGGGGFRYSPDGLRIAHARLDPQSNASNVWVDDLVRGTTLKVTMSRDVETSPVWSPDGRQLAYRSGPFSAPHIAISAADGSGNTTTLPCPGRSCEPTDWSPDGRVLLVNVDDGDVWIVPAESAGSPSALLAERIVERDARFSPDGRWISYVSEESGRPEVSVRSLSGPRVRYLVSRGGGDQPVWRRNGTELCYVDAQGQLFGVPFRSSAGDRLVFGIPAALHVPRFGERHLGTQYDISPDGRRVVFPHPGDERAPTDIRLILGWRALLN